MSTKFAAAFNTDDSDVASDTESSELNVSSTVSDSATKKSEPVFVTKKLEDGMLWGDYCENYGTAATSSVKEEIASTEGDKVVPAIEESIEDNETDGFESVSHRRDRRHATVGKNHSSRLTTVFYNATGHKVSHYSNHKGNKVSRDFGELSTEKSDSPGSAASTVSSNTRNFGGTSFGKKNIHPDGCPISKPKTCTKWVAGICECEVDANDEHLKKSNQKDGMWLRLVHRLFDEI